MEKSWNDLYLPFHGYLKLGMVGLGRLTRYLFLNITFTLNTTKFNEIQSECFISKFGTGKGCIA